MAVWGAVLSFCEGYIKGLLLVWVGGTGVHRTARPQPGPLSTSIGVRFRKAVIRFLGCSRLLADFGSFG